MNLHMPGNTEERITWDNVIQPEHWQTYSCVLQKVCAANLPFALGGGLAVGAYTGRLRRSKDLDIYILPEHREQVVRILGDCGLTDYHSVLPYDRQWIYRAHNNGVIVDAIWAMANRRAQVDEGWLTRGPYVTMFGQKFRVIPPEELIWSKIYVLQRDRCDWPDILNLMYATCTTLNWDHLIRRVGEDRPLVKGVLSVFSWVCPDRARHIPRRLWKQLDLPAPERSLEPDARPNREDLLDTRPWLFTEQQQCSAA